MTDHFGIFGLGLIGSALAGRLLAAGHTVTGYDPDPARGADLAQAGGSPGTPADVWQAPTVLAAVFDTDQLAQVIEDAPQCDGTRLLAFSTCDPDRMAGLGDRAAAKGITLIEAPISGTSRQLAQGTAVLLIGGDAATAHDLAPVFATLAHAHTHVGALGNGNRAKLAINLVLGLNRAALAEGLLFAERIGLDPGDFLALAQGSAAASQVMGTKGPLMVARDFAPQGRISQSAKDFALIGEAACAVGLTLPFTETYRAMMADCIDEGQGDLDNAAIILAVARKAETRR